MKVRDEAASLWTLPNRLSILRILFIPIIVLFISSQEDGLLLASCLLFIIAGITDGLDGYLARKMSLTSRLGVYLDPIADKLLVSSVLITLTYYHQIPLWVTLILVGREFLINGLRAFYAMEGIAIYPSSFGKIKTALQLIGISCLLFNIAIERIDAMAHQIGLVIIYGALFFSIYSAINYLTALFKPQVSKG
ncbi:MAG: CDP-diacylglycerol/glycerol-3-phosphate3-phospha tidyltransferase [Deltaproteobacteria bacterium]|nr:CDP-diacylglycerol/glycerol-3-phosphate3-phospha tidyltransferase [Deltaproteobacteria bacterium]